MVFLMILMTALCVSWLNPSVSSASRCSTQTLRRSYQRCTALPTQDASLAWTFHGANATLHLAFFGSFISPSGWVGWGLNPLAHAMTGARALLAFRDPNSGGVVVLPFVLDASVKLQRTPLLSRPLDIRLLSSSVVLENTAASVRAGARVQIHAALRLPSNASSTIHIVWNRGLYVQGYSPTIHPTAASDLSSSATIDLLATSSSTATEASPNNVAILRTLHGAINALAWGLLLPAGAVTARYLRHVESLGPTWFYVHMGIQLSGFILGTAGFAIGVRLGAMSPGVTYGLHRKLGFAAFGLGALQTLALVFRPKTTHKFRRYWKSYHHLVGYSCVVVGVVNVFQGFEAMGEGRSYAKLGYCLCLAALIGGCVSFEVNSWVVFCRKAKEEKLKREAFIAGVNSDKGSGIIHT